MNIVRVAWAAALLLLLLSGGALLAGEPMEATLVVPDVRILPGVPFDFWVELHNGSDSARRIVVCEPFRMRLVSGEPFQWTETREQMEPPRQFYWIHGGEAFVRPGETKILAIPAYDGLFSSGFFRDRRFSAPGRRFAIALPLCERVPTSNGDALASARLMTSEVEIEIMSPAGSDEVAWNRIEETSQHRWTPADMASPEWRAMWESVLRDNPDSNYVPYAVLMTQFQFHDWHDYLAKELRTIERFPDSPAREWLHVEALGTADALGLYGVTLAERAIVRRSKRPTTRLLAFGHEPRR